MSPHQTEPPDPPKLKRRRYLRRGPKPRKGLTPFARRFVSEYLKDLNGSAAVRRAGSKCLNPGQEAYDLLKIPEVRKKIGEAEDRLFAQNEIKVGRLLLEAQRIATVDMRSFYDEDNELLPAHQWTADMAAAVQSVEERETPSGNIIKKVKLNSKNQILELLFRHKALTTPDPAPASDVPVFSFPPGTKIAIT